MVEGMGGAKGRVSMAVSKQRRRTVRMRSRVNDGVNSAPSAASKVLMQYRFPMLAIRVVRCCGPGWFGLRNTQQRGIHLRIGITRHHKYAIRDLEITVCMTIMMLQGYSMAFMPMISLLGTRGVFARLEEPRSGFSITS